jgi:hypothetical protein
MNPARTLTTLTIALACLATACSSDTAAPVSTPAPTDAPAPTTEPAATPTTVGTTEPAPTTDPVATIDFDNPGLDVDLNAIAGLVGEGAEGDPEWIDVMAQLLARDWLGSRYPAGTNPLDVYSQSWVDEVVAENRTLFIENGWYRISDVPQLVSVERTRETGGLTELRVQLVREPSKVLSVDDNSVVNPSLGGTGPEGSTGLFKLGAPDDGSDGWRIYRIDQVDNATEEDGG